MARNFSPTDKPEHFTHTNSANSLISVWLATDEAQLFLDFFKRLGIPTRLKKLNAPFEGVHAQIAALEEGEVIFLPASFQVVPGHQIIGAAISITNIETLKRTLREAGFNTPAIVRERKGSFSLFLSPEETCGIWLEFRQR